MTALRLPVASGWGALVSLVMFWALWSMIDTPLELAPARVLPKIDFTPGIPDSKPAPKPREARPTLDIPPVPTRPGKIGVPNENARPARVIHERPRVLTSGTGVTITATGIGIDQDARPVVRIEPDYPPPAERRGMEGWVQVQFSVTRTGRVTDVIVIDASPRGVFEEASIEAVRRWLYNPKVEDGVAVERVGLRTVFVFEMPE